MSPRTLPTSDGVSRRMSRVRQKATSAELAVRRELFRLGLRYRVDFEVSKKPRRVADIAFIGQKVAIFVDGCFWHGCPLHASWPKSNAEFWCQKIKANRTRDSDTNDRLAQAGWTVLRFWEHEPPADAARRVKSLIDSRRNIRPARERCASSNRTSSGRRKHAIG